MFQLAMAHVELAEFEDAKEPLDTRYKLHQLTAVRALYNLGLLHYQDQDYASALKYLTILRDHYPSHDKGTLLLGDTYMHLNQPESAQEAYELSTQMNPNSPVAFHNLGKPA